MVQPSVKWPRPLSAYDPESKCEKCGFDQVDTFYCGPPYRCSSFIHGDLTPVEHHHRRCKRCGFDWIERCLYTKQGSNVIDLKEEKENEQG